MLLVCLVPSGSKVGAARALWSESVGAHIFGSDADPGLRGRTASMAAFNFIFEVMSDFMIAINVRLLESFDVGVDVFVRGWAHDRGSALDLHEGPG